MGCAVAAVAALMVAALLYSEKELLGLYKGAESAGWVDSVSLVLSVAFVAFVALVVMGVLKNRVRSARQIRRARHRSRTRGSLNRPERAQAVYYRFGSELWEATDAELKFVSLYHPEEEIREKAARIISIRRATVPTSETWPGKTIERPSS